MAEKPTKSPLKSPIRSPLKDGSNQGDAFVWLKTLGITEKGACSRHPECTVWNAEDGTISPCRLCFSEEKSVGIQQRMSFAAVVQEIQTNPSEGVTPMQTTPENEALSDEPKPTLESSIASSMMQKPDNFGSMLKRLSQVQNWMLRRKEKEVMSLQLQISKLEQKLADSETTVTEQNQTIRSLRRTIQQDLKLIKTMATQKQMEIDAEAEYEAHLQQQEDDKVKPQGQESSTEAEVKSSEDPVQTEVAVRSQPKISPKRATSPKRSMSPGRSSSRSPSRPKDPRLQGQLKFFQRATRARGGMSVPNKATLGRTRSFEGIPEALAAGKKGDIVLSKANANSSYWNEADVNLANDPTKLFASFRGGLLDIPTEPPKPTHANARHKLKIGSEEKNALQVPVRGVLTRTTSAEPTDFPVMSGPPPIRRGKKKNKVTVDTEAATESKDIPLNLLASSLNSLPLNDKSGKPKKAGGILPPPPMTGDSSHSPATKQPMRIPSLAPPTLLDMQSSPTNSSVTADTRSLDGRPSISSQVTGESTFFDASVMAEAHAAKEAAENSGLESSEKFLFPVTNAQCQDKYGDVGMYSGTILVTEGLPHGTGTMTYDSGRVYAGDWISGQWNGKGKLLNPNGDTYEGEFVFDARHGKGVYKWDNGDVYTGTFREDKRHGNGKFAFHNGNLYDGEFCDGMFEGFGKYSFEQGCYEGEWKEGRYDGNGELRYATGAKYTGEFRNSVAHGFGTEISADGQKRRGLWENGNPVE